MDPFIIDYSQYSLFNFCPWAWYERYVNQRQLRRTGQRSDPLCLGSLVHNGLDNFSKLGKPIIDEPTIIENEPTRETLAMAEILVQGYIKKYGTERWPVEATEQPLRFPLHNFVRDITSFFGLAKLDGYFYVPEDTTIESGLPGFTLTLARGWWAREFKTKAYSRKRSEWIKEWQTKRQADFQMLALQHYLRTHPHGGLFLDQAHLDAAHTVQGILICVLEKPYEHIPERKCKGCSESYPLASFLPKPEGFACPVCGHVQGLTPYRPKSEHAPEYFRITVTRTPEQLETARAEILLMTLEMNQIRKYGMTHARPNRDACINNVHRRECEYWEPHTYGGSTSDGFKYTQIDATKYMGLPA